MLQQSAGTSPTVAVILAGQGGEGAPRGVVEKDLGAGVEAPPRPDPERTPESGAYGLFEARPPTAALGTTDVVCARPREDLDTLRDVVGVVLAMDVHPDDDVAVGW